MAFFLTKYVIRALSIFIIDKRAGLFGPPFYSGVYYSFVTHLKPSLAPTWLRATSLTLGFCKYA